MKTDTVQNYFRPGITIFSFLLLFIFLPAVVPAQNSNKGAAAESGTGAAGMVAVSGTVKKTMNSGGYTYALVDDGIAKTWVALPKTSLAVGNSITCQPGMVMPNFTSSSLNYTFEQIVFSSGVTAVEPGTASPQESPAVETLPDLPKLKQSDTWENFFDKK